MSNENNSANSNQQGNGGNANQAAGGNANQGGGNSQGQGGNQNNQQQNQGGGNNQNQNQGNQQQGNGGNQGGDDYKQRYGDSTRENQRITDILKKHGIDPKTGERAGGGNDGQQQGGAADQQTFFTDAELEAAFPSYGTMSDSEKQILRQVGSFPKMARMVAEMHDKLTFTEQLEVLKADPANKILAEHEKDFKAFAYKDENLKVPIDILANAFMGMKMREQGNNNSGNNNQNQQQQRQGMENGSAGQGSSGDAVQEMTAEAARELRTKDPRKYQALVKSKKLKIVNG